MLFKVIISALIVNLEVLVYFLKVIMRIYRQKNGQNNKWLWYILISAGIKFRKKKISGMVYQQISVYLERWKYRRLR
jgi:hypothetical protein